MHEYFSAAVALQNHEKNVVRNYRRSIAEKYRQLADEAETKALRCYGDVIEQSLLYREAGTWRWAAAIVDVPEDES